MTLPLLLGECPSKSGDRYHHFPLSGAVGQRLCEFAGIPPESEGSRYGKWYWALLEHFDCLNAIERHGDSVPWDQKRAWDRWFDYLKELEDEELPPAVIALGRRAAATIGLGSDLYWGEWRRVPLRVELLDDRLEVPATVLPHPSTRNLLYNDLAMRERAGAVLRQAMTVNA